MKKKTIVPRDLHRLMVLKGEALGRHQSIPSKKIYKRKNKHRRNYE